MKSKLLFLVGACALGVTGIAQAADNTMTVTASLNGACGFVLPNSTLAFGVLDPTSAANATATTTVDYWCTTGTVAATVHNNGANWDGSNIRMKETSSANYIPYSLAVAGGAGTGAGKSSPLTMTVTGTIANANYVNAAVGSYADTVTLTVTP